MSQILDTGGEQTPPLRRRIPALAAVLAALLLARLPPRRIRLVLTLLRRGAAPAAYDQALAARQDVTATSTLCAGRYCLQRSLATALLCRLRGIWPTWCTGVRTPPFTAHAWVEADGRPVGEPADTPTYRRIVTVPPRVRH
ncbi:lasso peptide biosynthesis B2 protein [Streptomyces sp. NPDC052020]|uniref:lasso peptide biosynthesis B2 protein n=1 Tax=Streptomyces sp. NPDC052020 TaxID=3155677 RepID=UPI00343C649F